MSNGAAVDAASDMCHDSLNMAGQSGDVTVTSNAAGLPYPTQL